MSNEQVWTELTGELYAKQSPLNRSLELNKLDASGASFKEDRALKIPLSKRHQYWNIFEYEPSLFEKEYIENGQAAAFVKGDGDHVQALALDKVYCASSVQLNSLKKQILKNNKEGVLDLGIDPFSLGLWESKLFKSNLNWSELNLDQLEGSCLFRVSTLAYDMAGADLTQQLAIVLSGVVQLVEDCKGQLSPSQIFDLTSFEVSLNSNTLLGVAKLQTLRLLLAGLKEVFELEPGERASIFAVPSPRYLASRESWNNILRLSSMNMAAQMGGATGFVHLPSDLFSTNTESRLSRNIDLILQKESHLLKVLDPTLGSYSVDSLVEKLAERTWEFFQEIQNKEGLRKSLSSGWLQREIEFENKKEMDLFLSREVKMTGVNEFALLNSLSDENPLPSEESVVDIETWWSNFSFKDENEKLCDVERLVPIQLSHFFEKWQFKSDKMRSSERASLNVDLLIEPGLERSPKILLVKNILALAGLSAKVSPVAESVGLLSVIIAADPEGEFVNQTLEKVRSSAQNICLWAGEKKFDHFDGFVGKTSDLMGLFDQLFKVFGDES